MKTNNNTKLMKKYGTNLKPQTQNTNFMYLSCLWQIAALWKVPMKQPMQQHWWCTVRMITDHAVQWGVQLLRPHLRSSHSPHICTQATSCTGEFTEDSLFQLYTHSTLNGSLHSSSIRMYLIKLSPHKETNQSHNYMISLCYPFLFTYWLVMLPLKIIWI